MPANGRHATAPPVDAIDVDPGTSRTGRGSVKWEVLEREPYAHDRIFLRGKIATALGIQCVRSNLRDQSMRLTMFGPRDDHKLVNAIMSDLAEAVAYEIVHATVPAGQTRAGYVKSWISGLGAAVASRVAEHLGPPNHVRVEENIRAYRQSFPRTKRTERKVTSQIGYQRGQEVGRTIPLPSLEAAPPFQLLQVYN